MKPSQLAINSVSTRHADLPEALAAYQAAGFANVEWVLGQVKDYVAQGHTLAQVRGLHEARGLRCIGGFEGVLQAFAPDEEKARNHELIVQNARLLSELGGTILVVGTDGPADGADENTLDQLAENFASVARQIESTGVQLCIEFNWSPVVKSLRTAAEIARRSGEPNVGVLFDPAHYHCTPTKFEQLTAQNVAFIKHVHLNDMRDKPGEWSNCNSDRVLPGQGCLDLRALLGQIEAGGYTGLYSIEMFNDELWSMPPRQAARLMHDSLLPFCD